MSSEVAIRGCGLGKAYRVYSRPEDRLKQMFMGRWKKFYHEFWALQNVDFEIHRGESLGIIGRNGSGKSTLLQMICGTLTPTCGTLEVQGRIAALLELGAGFNPEFTGQENVFLNGAILGLDRQDMERRYDAIAAFADIGEFLDQPVRTYSSGMYARLAFAVAINVDPEILVVDEALAVGDEAFQRKCFGRIRQIRDDGATVLFVSHSASSVISLCNRAILLDHGHRLLTADPKTVVAKYQKLAYAPADKIPSIQEEIRQVDARASLAATVEFAASSDGEISSSVGASDFHNPHLKPQSTIAYESRGAHIEDARITDLLGARVNILVPGNSYRYTYTTVFEHPGYRVRFGMMIKTVAGVELAGAISHSENEGVEMIAAGKRVQVSFEFQNLLAPGAYFLNAGVLGETDEGLTYLARVLDIAMFRIEPVLDGVSTGMVNLMSPAHCEIRDVAAPRLELTQV